MYVEEHWFTHSNPQYDLWWPYTSQALYGGARARARVSVCDVASRHVAFTDVEGANPPATAPPASAQAYQLGCHLAPAA